MENRFTEEQIIRVLREAEAKDITIRDLCKRLKELESENNKLKRLLAEQMLVIEGLQDFLLSTVRRR
jgi:putative transposase